MATIDALLSEFQKRNAGRRWRPGSVDCVMTLADWLVTLGHRDPAAGLRGVYHDEAGYRAILAGHGGMAPMIDARATMLGLPRTATARTGDVGVIGSAASIDRQWGAIWDGGDWLVRFDGGFSRVKARAMAIWRVRQQEARSAEGATGTSQEARSEATGSKNDARGCACPS
ncbi:MAG: hypothetical protein KDJ90_12775 [Nitratireductor sp.]|nr:hypothetical protein [Nitratireductor sp.]